MSAQPAWFSVKDAVVYCGLGERTIQREMQRGNIRAKLYTSGNGVTGRKRRLISKDSLDAWIESLPDNPAEMN